MTGVRSGQSAASHGGMHVPDDLRVPEVLGDVASGVDLVTVALQARNPAGVVPLLGYEVQRGQRRIRAVRPAGCRGIRSAAGTSPGAGRLAGRCGDVDRIPVAVSRETLGATSGTLSQVR